MAGKQKPDADVNQAQTLGKALKAVHHVGKNKERAAKAAEVAKKIIAAAKSASSSEASLIVEWQIPRRPTAETKNADSCGCGCACSCGCWA
jgi:hypothetical protein